MKSLMKFTVYLKYLSSQKDKEGTNTTFEVLQYYSYVNKFQSFSPMCLEFFFKASPKKKKKKKIFRERERRRNMRSTTIEVVYAYVKNFQIHRLNLVPIVLICVNYPAKTLGPRINNLNPQFLPQHSLKEQVAEYGQLGNFQETFVSRYA